MFEITLPKAGKGMKDATIVRWLKSEGEAVQAGEVLLELQTDRATIEVESPHSGTLRKILVPQRATIPVAAPIAMIGDPGEDVSLVAAPVETPRPNGGAGAPPPQPPRRPAPSRPSSCPRWATPRKRAWSSSGASRRERRSEKAT